MMKNQKRIGYADEKLAKGSEFRVGREGFVPLADVPDYVWINSRPQEGIQHFADIDIHDIDGGPSLLQRCVDDPSFISAKRWLAYFKGFAARGVGPEEGALPFRVWQIWEDMVTYLKARDVARFVAAAGAMAHYVGDASQPLHCSYLHHGVPPMVEIDGRVVSGAARQRRVQGLQEDARGQGARDLRGDDAGGGSGDGARRRSTSGSTPARGRPPRSRAGTRRRRRSSTSWPRPRRGWTR